MGATTERQARVSNPVFARIFPRLSQAMDAGGMATRREDLLAGLTGQVIDIGAGTGATFGHYPATVTRVVAIEPEPRLRQIATAAARAAPVRSKWPAPWPARGLTRRGPAAGRNGSALGL